MTQLIVRLLAVTGSPRAGSPHPVSPSQSHFSQKMRRSQLPREVEPGRPGQGTQVPPNRQADRPGPHAPHRPAGPGREEAGGRAEPNEARPPPPGPPAGRPGRCLPEAVCAPADRADSLLAPSPPPRRAPQASRPGALPRTPTCIHPSAALYTGWVGDVYRKEPGCIQGGWGVHIQAGMYTA